MATSSIAPTTESDKARYRISPTEFIITERKFSDSSEAFRFVDVLSIDASFASRSARLKEIIPELALPLEAEDAGGGCWLVGGALDDWPIRFFSFSYMWSEESLKAEGFAAHSSYCLVPWVRFNPQPLLHLIIREDPTICMPLLAHTFL